MSAWSDIHRFIRQRAPSFDREAIPVPLEAIRMTERGLGICFPQTYVDFLTTAGEISGAYEPFLSRFNANFYDIVERVSNGTNYPIERYWPGGLRIDIHGDFHDPFIDLARSDGVDAPLVSFEPRVDFDSQEVTELMYTLAEELAANAFVIFEMERRKFSTSFLMAPDRPSFGDLLGCLELCGMTESVHVSRIRIFEGTGPIAVEVFDWGKFIGVDVAGEDERLCQRVISVIRDNITETC